MPSEGPPICSIALRGPCLLESLLEHCWVEELCDDIDDILHAILPVEIITFAKSKSTSTPVSIYTGSITLPKEIAALASTHA